MNPKHKLLRQILFALIQVRSALRIIESSPVIFYPDFNLLHPVLFRQNEKRYSYTDTFGTCLFALNDLVEKPPNLHICLSLPTVMEFIYSLNNHYQYFSRHADDSELSSYAHKSMTALYTGKMNIGEIDSQKVRDFIIHEQRLAGLDQRVAAIRKSILDGRIGMLTDYYSPSDINALLADKRIVLDQIKNLISAERHGEDGRSEIAKSVSYKVDAHNTFLVLLNGLNEKREINFVCSDRFFNWGSPDSNLQAHQRTPLMLIILLGNYGSVQADLPWAEKHRQIRSLVDQAIAEGRALVDYCDKFESIPLDMDRKIVAFTHANLNMFVQMAIDKNNTKTDGEGLPSEFSYKSYLEILEGRKRAIASSIRTVKELIDDTTDDMYRDFVSDDRIRKALSTLDNG